MSEDVEQYSVSVVLKNGSTVQGEFLATFVGRDCQLTLNFSGKSWTRIDSDFFEAMCQIRRELEPEGIQLVCYGASKNVRPSGMSRDMGGGVKAYRHGLGQKGGLESLVSIFETGPDVEPTTVAGQQAFFEEWLRSVGIDPRKRHVVQLQKDNRAWLNGQNDWFFILLAVLFIVLVVMFLFKLDK